MLDSFFGLPTHPLIVHATVVVVPAAATTVLVATLWQRFRSWAGWLPAALSFGALMLAPMSTSSGDGLEHVTGSSALVHEHAELGEMLVWWVLTLSILAALAWGLHHRPNAAFPSWAQWVLRGGTVVVAVGTLVMVALIGHSGAKAAWSDATASGAAPTTSAVTAP